MWAKALSLIDSNYYTLKKNIYIQRNAASTVCYLNNRTLMSWTCFKCKVKNLEQS